MHCSRWSSFAVLAATALALSTAPVALRAQTPTVTMFEGARLLTGDGGVIENSAFIVANDRFIGVGRRGELPVPPGAVRVDLAGKTVMPALVDVHVHMGYRTGTSFTADNYTRANLLDMLDRYAFYGVAAVLETGTGRGDLPYRVRAEARSGARYLTAGSGFGMPNAGPGGAMRDSAYGVTTEEEARRDVRELAAHKADMVKIWVDDRNGTVEKLKPNLYRAIIDEAHKNNLRAMAHVFALDDVKALVRAGIDGFAHMVRDKDVDDELIALLKQRPDVFFVATLLGRAPRALCRKPAWSDDPVLRQAFGTEDIKQLAEQLSPEPERGPKAVQRAREFGRPICATPRSCTPPARGSASAPTPAVSRWRILRPRLPCRIRASGDQGRADADAGDHRRNPYRGRDPRPRRPRHGGAGKERRLPGARRQSARRHRQYAPDRAGCICAGGDPARRCRRSGRRTAPSPASDGPGLERHRFGFDRMALSRLIT